MILLRDFALFVLPVMLAAGGWLYAFGLRKRGRPDIERGNKRVPAI